MKVSDLIDLLSLIDPDIEVFIQDNNTSVYSKIKEIEVNKLGEDGNQEAFIIIEEEEYSDDE